MTNSSIFLPTVFVIVSIFLVFLVSESQRLFHCTQIKVHYQQSLWFWLSATSRHVLSDRRVRSQSHCDIGVERMAVLQEGLGIRLFAAHQDLQNQ